MNDLEPKPEVLIEQKEPKEKIQSSDPQEPLPSESPLEAELSRLREEVEQWRERALRTAAEWENYRRRLQRDLPQQLIAAQADLLRTLLPLLDNIERGLRAAQEAPDIEKLREGLQLIHRQFLHTLQRLDVHPITPEVGSLPNPEEHEILSTLPAPEGSQPHTILEVVEPGFRFKGQLLRPARIIVTE